VALQCKYRGPLGAQRLLVNRRSKIPTLKVLVKRDTKKTVLEVTGIMRILTPRLKAYATRKLTSSSLGKYQTGRGSGIKYPKVNPTFDTIAYMTTDIIILG
jgi:hypothetical protein